jgi:ABC-type glycerol-3-phosphate transport system substrate-binding protein
MGNPSVVGDKMGWTVDDLNAAFKKMPEGSTIFDETMTRPDILNTCLSMDMDDYVNWTTGECSFDKGGFQKLLEFANSFPSDFDWKNYDWKNSKDPSVRVAEGKQMLMQAYIGQLTDYSMYKAEFGGKLTCVGFPTASGVGNMVSFNGGYAISAKCSNPDGAWQFVRTFLTKDFQESSRFYGLPTNKDAFNDAMKEAMTKTYQTDENGKPVLDKNGNKIEQPIGGIYISQDKSIDYYALTQADEDDLMTVINSATKVLRQDQNIADIINDECKAYFDGEKTAEETAKLVQSRVSIYVNEQS